MHAILKQRFSWKLFPLQFSQDSNEKDLKEVVLCGCCTDLCVMNFALPLKTYINEHDLDIKVTIYKNAVETYDLPIHNREEYNEIAFKIMNNAGIKLVKTWRNI